MIQTHKPTADRIALKDVTLCAVSSSNIVATINAMMETLDQVDVAEALLLTHTLPTGDGLKIPEQIRLIQIDPIRSADQYSEYVLTRLARYVGTSHCLIVQWDGHVVDGSRWQDQFLEYDYIGASWPQFGDGHEVGNGGFSLRSKRLLEACQGEKFVFHHPEDVAICRTNRTMLEEKGFRFAPVEIADQFSAERTGDARKTFGYHGVFLMPQVLGPDRFWDLYCTLDHRESVYVDFWAIARSMQGGRNATLRILKLISDRVRDKLIRS